MLMRLRCRVPIEAKAAIEASENCICHQSLIDGRGDERSLLVLQGTNLNDLPWSPFVERHGLMGLRPGGFEVLQVSSGHSCRAGMLLISGYTKLMPGRGVTVAAVRQKLKWSLTSCLITQLLVGVAAFGHGQPVSAEYGVEYYKGSLESVLGALLLLSGRGTCLRAMSSSPVQCAHT